MRNIWWTAAFLVVLATQAWSDQLYLRNRLFKGYAQNVSKKLDRIQIDLLELCKAVEFEIKEVDDNRFLVPIGQEPNTEGITGSKQLFFEGKPIQVVLQDHRETVNLQEFTQVVGGRLSYNSGLSVVDFNLSAASKSPSQKGTPNQTASVSSSSGYTLLNFFGKH